ncbi:AraC family transcriptional regulator [Anaerosporobacter faecicola]|uniref:AraC family transcriptional regulator n=1 Tax=Anaerosporobacter faecicola TaxID=2718714 RepID=UPI0014387895|nr:AraC family transcriptional regulator [Anaerosporobacter faecicola]
MNYRKEFEICFAYVEQHLKEPFTVNDLAASMGYSLFHFCRIFYAYQGMTPKEYVLERRLQAALVDLKQGDKIIDVACTYCFETASGFAKSFRKRYGISPKEMKKKIDLEWSTLQERKSPSHIRYQEIDAFIISGYCHTFDYNDHTFEKDMVAYWEQFEEENVEERLYHTLNPSKHGEIGIVIRKGENTTCHEYLLGVVAENREKSQPWHNYQIAGGQYAVFTTFPIDMTKEESSFARQIRETWRYIFMDWFETVAYTYDDSREAFEYYDERCHYGEDAVMDIYIPIKEEK